VSGSMLAWVLERLNRRIWGGDRDRWRPPVPVARRPPPEPLGASAGFRFFGNAMASPRRGAAGIESVVKKTVEQQLDGRIVDGRCPKTLVCRPALRTAAASKGWAGTVQHASCSATSA